MIGKIGGPQSDIVPLNALAGEAEVGRSARRRHKWKQNSLSRCVYVGRPFMDECAR